VLSALVRVVLLTVAGAATLLAYGWVHPKFTESAAPQSG
jgi:hypothetical protein